jgi:hypothetical protein
MAQPFNYSLGLKSPMQVEQEAFTGQMQGLELRARMQQAQAQAIAEQQQAQQAALFQQQRQAAFDRALSPNATHQDLMTAAAYGNKEQSELFQSAIKQMTQEQQMAAARKLSRPFYAAATGSQERFANALNLEREANKDIPERLAYFDELEKAYKADPDAVTIELGGQLSEFPEGQKIVDNVLSLTKNQREAAQAKRTKLSPGIQEAIDFKNLPQEDKQAFVSLQTLKRPPPAVTNVNVTNLDKSAATQLGELVPKLYEQANSAASQVAQLPRYRRALDSAITGPLADSRLTAARIGSALGFSGDKAVSATTELVQGLAEMALQSRSMLTGQGQITENEQKLLTKARSGDLNLTKSELQTIFSISDRAARAQYAKSRKLLESASSKSETAGLFLQNVPSISETQPEQPQGRTGVTVTLPNGQSFVFPNQQAADQFKARAGVR